MSKKPAQSAGAEPADATVDPAMTFEQAQAELEAIIARIESGESGLAEAMSGHERGVALLKHCRTILERAEQSFTDLTSQMKAE